MPETSCPSCGGPVHIKSKAALLVVCEYCNSTLMRKDMNLADLGKMADLAEDGSPVQLGASGSYRARAFEVVGRIQLEYAQGFWNEWFLQFADGGNGWLGEGQGQYTVSFVLKNPGEIPAFEKLKPGRRVRLGVEEYHVKEVSSARCVAGAGELPFQVNTGYDARVVDLDGTEVRFATIDYSEDPPLVFTGERVEFDALQLKGLREFEGWR
jgi:hypothetical protein